MVLGIIRHYLNLWINVLIACLRFFHSNTIAGNVTEANRPKKNLILYDFEGCMYCKYVREICCLLAIDYDVIPCPKVSDIKNSPNRSKLFEKTEKAQFPYMIDPNTGTEMFESKEIGKYLFKTYGKDATIPWRSSISMSVITKPILLLHSLIALSVKKYGCYQLPSLKPEKNLILWGCENSPFTGIVREVLCSLELQYTMITAPHLCTWKRNKYRERFGDKLSSFRSIIGVIQCPLLEDPNTGTIMVESRDISNYLLLTYGPDAALKKKNH